MKRFIKSAYILQRARALIKAGQSNFNRAVYGCANVSRFNPDMCFVVERSEPFGSPVIRWIERPKEVVIYERLNGVIVKDGIVYEMTKENG